MTYRGHIRNGQVRLDKPAQLPEGAEVNVVVLSEHGDVGSQLGRRDLLRMPVKERRQLLMQQADRVAEHYEPDSDRSDWQGGDIVE
jgi:hypothetical protein